MSSNVCLAAVWNTQMESLSLEKLQQESVDSSVGCHVFCGIPSHNIWPMGHGFHSPFFDDYNSQYSVETVQTQHVLLWAPKNRIQRRINHSNIKHPKDLNTPSIQRKLKNNVASSVSKRCRASDN